MASLRKRRQPYTRTIACYDTMTFLGRKYERGEMVSGGLLDGSMPADKIELTFINDRAIALMNLQQRLGRAPCPISTPLSAENTAMIRLNSYEAKYELRSDGYRGWRGIELGDLKELRECVGGFDHPHEFVTEVNILEPGKGCGPVQQWRLGVSVEEHQDYNLWQVVTRLTLDDNGEFFIAVAPQPYRPENFISYGKLRQGNERAEFSEEEIKRFRRWIREAEEGFYLESEQETESDEDDGEEDDSDENDGDEDDDDEDDGDEDDGDEDDGDEDDSDENYTDEDDTEQDDDDE